MLKTHEITFWNVYVSKYHTPWFQMRNLAIQSDPLSPKRNDNAKTVVYKKQFGISLLRTTIFGINKNNFVINNTLLQKPN